LLTSTTVINVITKHYNVISELNEISARRVNAFFVKHVD